MDRGQRHINTILLALKRSRRDIYGGAFVESGHDMQISAVSSKVKIILEKKKAGQQKLDAQENVDYDCFRNTVALLARMECGRTLATVLSELKNPEHLATMHELLATMREFFKNEGIQVPVLESK